MSSTLPAQATQENAPWRQSRAPLRAGLQWLESKLSRVTSSREFIPEVDGLRFVAIFFVLVFHSAVHILHFQHRPPIVQKWAPGQSWTLGVIGNLFLGVQIFFVISGLVVALPFARCAIQGSARPSLSRYFMRRLTRIEPPYILALLAMYCLLREYRFYAPHLLAGLFYMHRWIYGMPNPINQVTWTLEIEVVFYLLAPWFAWIYRIPGKGLRRGCQVLLLGASSYFVHNWFLQHEAPRSYYSFTAALPFFQAGILLADLYVSGWFSRSNRLAWDGAALLGMAALLYCHYVAAAWKIAWLSPLMIMMMVAGGLKGSFVNRFLRFRPITLIGGMCYSIYLWHIPLLNVTVRCAAMLPPGLSDVQMVCVFCVAAVPLLILFSVPFYYFTERPFMNGPGSRFLERALRFVWGRVRTLLAAPAEA